MAGSGEITVAVFALPTDGANPDAVAVRTVLDILPKARIRYPW